MSETSQALEIVLESLASHRNGHREEAIDLLQNATERGIGGKKIMAAFLEQIASAAKGAGLVDGHESRHTARVLDHLATNASQIRKRSYRLISSFDREHPAWENVVLLDTEINILLHELDLSLQRGQLQNVLGSIDLVASSLEELNRNWFTELKVKATSQLGQDLWVAERCAFKRGGFFVEFGATNGILLSNTYLLEKAFGWDGICAEPNPEFHEILKKNRLCTVSEECIGSSTGEEVEFVFADVFGGMVADMNEDEHKEKREAYRASGATAHLTTISLNDFLGKHKAPKTIDYLSVDTEGSEFAILETFPFADWDIRHITVEHNRTPQRDLIYELLSGHGYQRQEAEWDDWYYKD